MTQDGRKNKRYRIGITVAALGIAAAGSLIARWVEGVAGGEAVALKAPQATEAWVQAAPADNWQPVFHGAAQQVRYAYRNADATVYFYAARYARQRQGKELISSENSIYDPVTWRRIDETSATIALEEGNAWHVNKVLVESAQQRRLIWYWYDVGGHATAGAVEAKLIEIGAKLRRDYRGSTIIALAADYEIHPEDAEATLSGFLRVALPDIRARLVRR